MSISLSVVQFKPGLEKSKENFEFINRKSKDIDADIIVFPELSTSGYLYTSTESLVKHAMPFNDERISEIQFVSTELNKIIIFGFPEIESGKFYNSAAILFPESSFSTVYRKIHLFYKESLVFEQGNKPFSVINYKPMDINIGTMICYDWRFPEAARSLGLQGADLIVCPSNLVTNVWHIAMPARALENKVYLAVANRTGDEERGEEKLHFNGKSAIYGYNGEEVAIATESSEEIITFEIEPEKTRDKSFNEFNNIFRDRRPGLYNI